jgi:hypothetical protein
VAAFSCSCRTVSTSAASHSAFVTVGRTIVHSENATLPPLGELGRFRHRVGPSAPPLVVDFPSVQELLLKGDEFISYEAQFRVETIRLAYEECDGNALAKPLDLLDERDVVAVPSDEHGGLIVSEERVAQHALRQGDVHPLRTEWDTAESGCT